MSQRRTNRYETLSDQALHKNLARVRNSRRRSQILRAMSHRGVQ